MLGKAPRGANQEPLTVKTERMQGRNSTGKDTSAIWTYSANVAAISYAQPCRVHPLKKDSPDSFREQGQKNVDNA